MLTFIAQCFSSDTFSETLRVIAVLRVSCGKI